MSERTFTGSMGKLWIACLAVVLALAGAAWGSTLATSAATDAEPVKIVYYHTNQEEFGLPAIRDQIAAFQELHPNITVSERFNDSYQAALQRTQADIAAGNPPDVVQIGHFLLPFATENFPHVSVADIGATVGDEAYFDDFLPSVLGLGTHDGKLEGMPYSISSAIVFFNLDLLREAGVEQPPATWEQVLAAAQAVKDKMGVSGTCTPADDETWLLQAYMNGNGGQLLSEDGTQAGFNSPESIEALQLWGDMVQDGLAVNAGWDGCRTGFLTGDIAMKLDSTGNIASTNKAATFDVITARFPQFEDKPRGLPAGGNSLWIFSEDLAKQEAAWEFIKFLTGPVGDTMWVKGTGYLPVRKGLLEDERYLKTFFAENPLYEVAVDQLEDIVPWITFPGPDGLQAEKVLVDARDRVLTGQQDAQTALAEAQQEVDELIAP